MMTNRRKLSWILVMFTLITQLTEGKPIEASRGCHPQDLKGLTSFKAGIHVDTSGRLRRWVGSSCCNWDGVSCNNRTRRITEIRLPGFLSTSDFILQTEMKGLLSPSITLLASLQVLDLGGLTSLGGPIPASIGLRLPNLRKLLLYGNKLSGAIPESIGKLSKLQQLHLHENQLSGRLPWSLGNLRNLNTLLAYANQISGPIPDSLTELTNLHTMDLHGNSITGCIPKNIGSLNFLEELDLSSNRLSGKLPVSIANLSSISVLYLDTNLLQGEITFPSNIGEMSSLGFLRLHDNRLTGRIPPAFGNLVSLQRVSLANNKLQGTIPYTIGNLSSVTEMYLNGNQLSGHIPNSLGRLSRLIYLSISNNLIQGELPYELSSLENLQTLDLSFNLLNVSNFPIWLGEMPSLCRIFLAGSNIKGPIPELLRTTPSAILELDLSSNHLTGSLPLWLGSLTQLYSLNLSKNSLVSEIPATVANLQDLGVLDLHSNQLTGPINQVFEIESRFQEGSLTHVDLSDNRFSGGIEAIGVGGQTKIRYMSLSQNYLTGRLPESIAKVSSLETLKLQRNKFTGEIPKGFLKLEKLGELDLSDNLLEGKIPSGKPLSYFPMRSFSGNKGLCGKPLSPCKL